MDVVALELSSSRDVVAERALSAPNGIAVSGDRIAVATLGAFPPDPSTPGRIFTLDSEGRATQLGTLEGAFDGIEADGDGWIVSDFTGPIYRVAADGTATELLDVTDDGASSAADIGFDPVRRVVMVPDLVGSAVYLYTL